MASVKLTLVDDHILVRKGLISLIEMASSEYSILFEADNGLELQQKLDDNDPPDIILMDVEMPEMDGFDSVEWLHKHYPNIKTFSKSSSKRVRHFSCRDHFNNKAFGKTAAFFHF